MDTQMEIELDLLETITDIFIRFNNNFEIIYMNESAKAFLGFTALNKVGNKKEIVLNIQSIIEGTIKDHHSLSAPFTHEIEVSIPTKKYFNAKFYPSETGISVLLIEITTSKKVEIEIEENYKQLMLLDEASNHLIFNHEPKKILDSLFESLSKHLDLDVYFNYLFDEEEGKLQLTNYMGVSKEVAKSLETLNLGEAVCGSVAKDRAAIVTVDIHKSIDPRVKFIKRLGIQAYICQPLLSYGKLIGTLSFGSKKRSYFTPFEISLVEKISKRVAKKFERTFLIYDLKNKNKQLQQNNTRLIDSEKKLNKAFEKAEVANNAKSNFLLMISHELRTPLNTILGFSQLLEEELSQDQLDKIIKIQAECRQLTSFINVIIDYVRFEDSVDKCDIDTIKVTESIQQVLKHFTTELIEMDIVVNLDNVSISSMVEMVSAAIFNGSVYLCFRKILCRY